MRPRSGDLCAGCPGRDCQPQTVPESILARVLTATAVWRTAPMTGVIFGFDAAELRARLADLPAALKSETLALAFDIEGRAAAALRGDTDADP